MSQPTPDAGDALFGQLVAELAKFGGMDKQQASRLSQILLPFIAADRERYFQARLAEVLPEKRTNYEFKSMTAVDQRIGWNECIDQIEQNAAKGRGEEE